MTDKLAEQLSGLGSLSEPARRALYFYVVGQDGPVSREEAGRALEIPVHTAKFHLDRLVDEGLLDVEFRRLSGKSGPGAGRPSKLYRRSSRQLSVSLPERRYDLVGGILAEAVDRSLGEGVPLEDAVAEAAGSAGRRLAGSGATGESELERTADLLGRNGFEPRISDDEICLANCPFDALARDHTALVCGLNLAFVAGALEGLGVEGLQATLDPEPGQCCVKTCART